MCAIIGWNDKPSLSMTFNSFLECLMKAKTRGRDGWGFQFDGQEERGVGAIPEELMIKLYKSNLAIGNFRATPTTEKETRVEILQPYNGVVHNGTIANDKEFGDYEIDSMVLPDVLKPDTPDSFKESLNKLKGSYAILMIKDDLLYYACNYKPLFYTKLGGGFLIASMPYMLPHSQAIQVSPYSYGMFSRAAVKPYENKMERFQPRRAIVSCSAGLDSTTVAYDLKKQGYEVILAHFKYGCLAEGKELDRVTKIADHGGFELVVMELPKVFAGTIVNGDYHKKDVEGVEYAHDWVSARNLLMLSILTAYAETHKIGYIAFGGNLEESGAFPDNEEIFAYQFNKILDNAVQNGTKIELLHPLTHLMKHEIVKMGLELGVPYELTWSCYGDGDKHCQSCGPCFMRKTAFERNGTKDPVM